jgi:hypothetical protein
MIEARRLAYLQAMEIDSYVSRWDLPGACPSRRAPAARVPVAASPERPLIAGTGTSTQGRAAPLPAAPRPAAAEPATAEPATPAQLDSDESLPVFSLAVTLAGGWCWLDEIPPGREPGEPYYKLLEGICLALRWPISPPDRAVFSFPMGRAPKLGCDLPAAREALAGFLMRRLEQAEPGGVILLGGLDQPWFDRSCLKDLPVLATASAWDMLRDPAQKRRAWVDLRALRGDGG